MGVQKIQYQGFGIRFLAYSIDVMIFLPLSFFLKWLVFTSSLSLISSWLLNLAIYTLLFSIYEIVLTTRCGGTVGKILLKIKVADYKGDLISYYDSIVRYVSKWLSTLTIGIGYLMIIWTSKKQGLHDKIAETYVISNAKSKVNNNVKKVLIFATIIIISGFIMYILYLMVIGFAAGFQTGIKSINTKEPVKSVLSNCDSKFPKYKDICISLSAKKKGIKFPNISSHLELCSHIRDKHSNRDCVLHAARVYNNQSICSNAKSRYNIRLCEKTFNFSKRFYNFLHPKVERKFNGTLNIGKTLTGLRVGNKCIESKDNKFINDDIACFAFYNISSLGIRENGLTNYDIDLKIWIEKGDLIKSGERLLKYNEAYRTERIIDEQMMASNLSILEPGKYIYEYLIYDLVSNKAISVNKTIEVINKPKNGLKIMASKVGLEIGDNCVYKSNNSFKQEDAICMYFYNVSSFARLKDGYHLFEFGITVKNNSGETIYENDRVYEEDGHLVLRNDVLDGYGIRKNLKNFKHGNYQLKTTIYDRVSKKQAHITENFTVIESEPNRNLRVDNFRIGYYDGRECVVGSRDKFTNEETICLEPEVSGFEKDANGKIWFNMDQSIWDGNGQPVDQSKDNFGENGESSYPPLAFHYVYFSLKNLKNDKYIYEVTIHDNLGKRSTKINKTFYITDKEQLPKNDANDFFEIYYGAGRDVINYKQTKTYLIKGNSYEITFSYIGDKEAQFIVNGMRTDILKEGEYDSFFGNFAIKLVKIIETDELKQAKIYLGLKN